MGFYLFLFKWPQCLQIDNYVFQIQKHSQSKLFVLQVGTEIAETAKYFLAILDMTGNLASYPNLIFRLSKFSYALFFLPTIRIRKTYSNVECIKYMYYSNSRNGDLVKSRYKTVVHVNKYVILDQTVNYNERKTFKLLLFFIVNLNRLFHSFWVIRHLQNVLFTMI
jgi:hypothetical protein